MSLLPHLSKIIEKMTRTPCQEWADSAKMIDIMQCGFQKKRASLEHLLRLRLAEPVGRCVWDFGLELLEALVDGGVQLGCRAARLARMMRMMTVSLMMTGKPARSARCG
jgi:hypothetical protein